MTPYYPVTGGTPDPDPPDTASYRATVTIDVTPTDRPGDRHYAKLNTIVEADSPEAAVALAVDEAQALTSFRDRV